MKKSERRLLLLFGAVLAIGVLYMGSLRLLRWNEDLAAETLRLEREGAERELLNSEQDVWLERAGWMEGQPEFESQLAAESALIEDVKTAAEEAGLKILKRGLIEKETAPHRTQVGLSLSMEGSLDGLIQWMYSLQRPKYFRVIKKIRIIPGEEDPAMLTCQMEVVRWYRPSPEA